MTNLSRAIARASNYHRQGEHTLAEGLYRHALREHPAQAAEAAFGLGVLAYETGRLDLAVEMLEQAVASDGSQADWQARLGAALAKSDRLGDAERHLRQAMELDATCVDAWVNLAGVLHKALRYEEALPIGRRAVELAPRRAQAYYNLGTILLQLGEAAEAIGLFEAALAIQSGYADAHWNLAAAHLASGHFAEGWAGYDWRERAHQVRLRRFDEPRWDGSSLEGRTILIHGEQGLGDEILFGSCIPEVAALAKRCLVGCDPRLATLFARSFPQAEICAMERSGGATWRPAQRFDVHLSAGSVPRLLRGNWEAFPQREHFLVADARDVEAWRARLAELGTGLKVGISWRAGGVAAEQRRRTTDLTDWRALFEVPGVEWVNLQYGDAGLELQDAAERLGVRIHDWDDIDPLGDMDRVAAQIAALDLVICVANTTAHLAGALGVPTWVALPKVPGWRWMLSGERMPWYPSVRLHRQAKTDDWSAVFGELAERLRERVAASGAGMARQVPDLGGNDATTSGDGNAERLLERIRCLRRERDFVGAEAAGREMVKAFAESGDGWDELGLVCHAMGRLDEALVCFRRALELEPSNGTFYYHQGDALLALDRPGPAIQALRTAVTLRPRFPEAYIKLAAQYEMRGMYKEALPACREAVKQAPGNKIARYSLGTVLLHQGKIDAAVAELDEACQIDPEFALAHWNSGLALLQLGRYREGWERYEWRERAGVTRLNRCAAPLWDGSSLRGKTIAVLAEQGAGDEVMFASCYGELLSQAARVVVCCGPRFARLFGRTFPGAMIHTMQRVEAEPVRPPVAVDCYVHAGSLPRFFRPDADSFPQRERFLSTNPRKVEHWRRRYAELGPGLKIGISWQASQIGHEQRLRSTRLEVWHGLLRQPGVQFVNLQHGDTKKELEGLRLEHGLQVHDWSDANPLGDFDDYAAQIAALDAVVSVGNTVVHLAGALGVRCWALLPKVTSWRWLQGSNRTPWYASVRVMRQAEDGEWQPVFERMGRELGAWQREEAGETKEKMARNVLGASSTDDLFRKACRQLDAKQYDLARESLDEVVRREPKHGEACHRLGVVEFHLKDFAVAEEMLRRAVALTPGNAMCHYHWASALYELDRLDEAIEALRDAVRLAPDLAEAQLNLGGLLERRGRFEEAEPACRRAMELSPGSAKAAYNLGNVCFHQGRAAEAIEHYRLAHTLQPDYAKAHWNHGMAALQLCRFAEGWDKYEWREKAGEVVLDHCAKPLWDGSSLADKNLLVMAEQGVGDEIMFATCYHEVIAQAKHCLIVCQPRLASLFKRSFPEATVHGFLRSSGNRWQPPVPIDCYVPAGSLPRLLRPTWESFPQREYFLVPDARQVKAWRERLDRLGPGLKVGISWRAGGVAKEQLRRSTELELWRGLFEVPGVEFVNLQYGDCEEDLRLAREQWGVTIHDFAEANPLGELDTVAAQIAALDLVISVGNTAVHMAGSMGVPTWTILPRVPGWRWMLEGDRTPWYSTVRLFRQTDEMGWDALFNDLQGRLADWAGRAEARRDNVRELRPLRVRAEVAASRPEEQPQVLEVERLVQHGDEQLRTGQFEAAEHSFRQALKLAPRQGKAWLGLGRLGRQTGRLADAVDAFREVLAEEPTNQFALVGGGGTLLQLGRADEALALFERAVVHYPEDVNARVCWGVALHQLGRREEAIDVYRRALELNPREAQGWNNLGCALQELNREEESLDAFDRALSVLPEMSEAHQGRGTSLRKMGRLAEALASYERAASLRPNNPSLQVNVGGVLRELGRAVEAIAWFCRAAELGPRLLNAWVGWGVALETAGRAQEAVAVYDKGLALLPQAAELHYNRANVLRELGRFEEAEAGYRAALAARPGYDKAHTNLARTLRQQSRPDEAIGHCEAALQTIGDRPGGWTNLAVALLENGQLEDARGAFERALAERGDFVPARISLALLTLLQGDYAAGWRAYEARWQTLPVERQPYRRLECPVWEGESLAGKTIFVHAEQGVGDDVMFASCWPDLIERAGHCVVECDRRLVDMVRRSMPGVSVVGSKGEARVASSINGRAIDVQILAGSVPRYLRSSKESFPDRGAFLVADAARVAAWRERYARLGDGIKIGISWIGGGEPDERRQRSTDLAAWLGLLKVGGASFVNLQYGAERRQAEAIAREQGVRIHDWEDVDPLADLEGQAAQIAALDGVISVSNATVHLAGALGVRTWNLLSYVPSWRWLLGVDRSVWYRSVRLLRCPRPGEWGAPLSKAEEIVRLLVSERRGGSLRLDAAEGFGPTVRVRQTKDRARPGATE